MSSIPSLAVPLTDSPEIFGMVLVLVGQAKNSSERYWHSAGTLTLIPRVSVGTDVNPLSMALCLSPDFAYYS